jgi:hypothetical protein
VCRRHHLHHHLFCNLHQASRGYTHHQNSIQGASIGGEVEMRELKNLRFDKCVGYSQPRPKFLLNKQSGQVSKAPCIINVQLLWDIPFRSKNIVGPSSALDMVSTKLFDLPKVLKPTVHGSASDSELAKHREYIQQRKWCALPADSFFLESVNEEALVHGCLAHVCDSCHLQQVAFSMQREFT